jgi:hypothetical protein
MEIFPEPIVKQGGVGVTTASPPSGDGPEPVPEPVRLGLFCAKGWTFWYRRWLRYLVEEGYCRWDARDEHDRAALTALDRQLERADAALPEGVWFAAGSDAVFGPDATPGAPFDSDALLQDAWDELMADWRWGWRPGSTSGQTGAKSTT